MGILDNIENSWDEEFKFEYKKEFEYSNPKHSPAPMKIFSESCSNGCTCTSEADHKKEI